MARQTQQICVIIETDGGSILIDIMNDHGLEQLVHFPTRGRNTLHLILTSLTGQLVDINSTDSSSMIMTLYLAHLNLLKDLFLCLLKVLDKGQGNRKPSVVTMTQNTGRDQNRKKINIDSKGRQFYSTGYQGP